MTPRQVNDIISQPWDDATPKQVTEILWFIANPSDTDLRNRCITWVSYVYRELLKEAGRLTDEVRSLRRS